MKKEIKNIGASVRERLKTKSDNTKRPFQEVLQYYGMERFLYRLSRSEYADRFILKGALMFTVWKVEPSRSTFDIDFLARLDNQIETVEKIIKDVCEVKVPSDGLSFNPKTVRGERIREDADYQGVRVKFTGFLERSRILMQVDVGFGDVVYPKPKEIDYPVILDFPKPHLKGYSMESVIAEKTEAMVNLGSVNTRMKDFYDVWIMIRQFDFKGESLATALKKTFAHRKTPLPKDSPLFANEFYDEASHRQTLWSAFLSKNQMKNMPKNLNEVVGLIESFLIESLTALADAKAFEPHWKAPGPWC